VAGGQKLQDDVNADEARPASDQNSAHCQIPLVARAGELVPPPCSRRHLVTISRGAS